MIKSWLEENRTRNLYITDIINKGYVSKDLNLPLLAQYFGINLWTIATNGDRTHVATVPRSRGMAYFTYNGNYFNYYTASTEPGMGEEVITKIKTKPEPPPHSGSKLWLGAAMIRVWCCSSSSH